VSNQGFFRPRWALAGLVQVLPYLFIAAITIGGFEVGLRLFPALIPISALADFPPPERRAIAARLNLPTTEIELAIIRDDGGPNLSVWQPGAEFQRRSDDVDLTYGAVENYKMDGAGFCNPTDPGARDAHDANVKIVTIGDSFTWCTAVSPQDTWTAVLKEKTQSSGRNLGRSGIGPYEYTQIYRTFGSPLKPATVIMNIYEGNDLRDALVYYKTREPGRFPSALPKSRGLEFNAELPVRVGRRALREIRDGILGRSYAIDLFVGLTLQILPKNKLPENFTYRVQLGKDEVVFNRTNSDTDEIHHARLAARVPTLFEAFRDAMVRFRTMADADNFRPILAYTPSAYTAYSSAVKFDDPALKGLLAGFSRTQRDWFRDVCKDLDIDFVDLTPHMQITAQNRPLMYFPSNLHLTVEGHHAVAEALAMAMAMAMQTTGE
jgi:hypothetical protein